ncbi:hypothetical protein BIW11_10872, partial [Tropilaelaps mercedesae]
YFREMTGNKVSANKVDFADVGQLLLPPPWKNDHVAAVLVLTRCDLTTVHRPLDQLLALRPSLEEFPIIVATDCNDTATLDVIRSYGTQVMVIEYPIETRRNQKLGRSRFAIDYRITDYYGWALNITFLYIRYKAVIVLEDDLEISPDFFSYFKSLLSILEADKTLYCVSAWNDNGKANLIEKHRATLLHRTDFFSGVSWMLTRSLWMQDLMREWPDVTWKDWMRKPAQLKNRSCIRPEISRASKFGPDKASNSQTHGGHPQRIHLNRKPINFSNVDLSYLIKENYDLEFVKQKHFFVDIFLCHKLYPTEPLRNICTSALNCVNIHFYRSPNLSNKVYSTPAVKLSSLISGTIRLHIKEPVRLRYKDSKSFKQIAKTLGLSEDIKSGVPRTAYRGVVTFSYHQRRVYLTPSCIWTGYEVNNW